MTHLRILQSDSAIEQVSSAVISKLYELANNNTFDNTSDLVGRLSATAAYADEVSWLTLHYLNLYITADKLYIRFEDPVTELICVTNFSSDGVGCTLEDLATVTSIPDGTFGANSGITKFNEFRYFTGITATNSIFSNNTTLLYITLPNNLLYLGVTNNNQGSGFSECSSLVEINIPNGCVLASTAFKNCTSLYKVTFGQNVDCTKYAIFQGCSALTTLIGFDNVTNCGGNTFYGCTSLSGTFVIPNTILSLGGGLFSTNNNITKIEFEPGGTDPLTLNGGSGDLSGVFTNMGGMLNKYICFPERLSYVNEYCLGLSKGIKYIFSTTTPPSYIGSNNKNLGWLTGNLYVPDSAVNTYKAASGFSSHTDKIKGYNVYQYTSSTWSEVSNPTEVLIMTAADNIINATPTGSTTDGALRLVIQS